MTQSLTVEGVSAAFAPDTPAWRHADSALIGVIPTDETVDSENAKVVDRLRDAISDVPGFVGISGAGAVVLDYINAVYGTSRSSSPSSRS